MMKLPRRPIADAITGKVEAAEVDGSIPQVQYPNVNGVSGTPRIECEWVAVDRREGTLTEDGTIEAGRFGGTVVVLADGGEDEANGIADAFSNIFHGADALTPDGIRIEFNGVPIIRGGYRDGAEWRVPVIVPYLAFAS